MALSPWPTSPAALANATATLKASLGADLDDARVQALGSAAAELVERYAAGAPQTIKDEAATRTAGYLAEQPAAALYSEQIGDVQRRHAATHVSALRHSGSMALLSSWKIRRAGTIG